MVGRTSFRSASAMSDSCTLRQCGRTVGADLLQQRHELRRRVAGEQARKRGVECRRRQHLTRALDAGAHLLLGQRPLPARIAVDHHQGRDEVRPPAVELQGDRAAPREARDMRRAELELLDQRGEAVRVAGQVEVRGDVGRLARAGLVPRHDRELVGQALELRLPEAPVRRGAMHEHERRPLTGAPVGDVEPVPLEGRAHGSSSALVGDGGARRAGERHDLASLKPTSRHQPAKSAPVKSKASPNSISMLSDIISPNAFSRRASSMRFSMTMNAPPSGSAS